MTRLQSVTNRPPELVTHLTLQYSYDYVAEYQTIWTSDLPDSAVDETT